MTTKPKSKPIHEIRLGLIKAAIWENDTEHGIRHSVTFSRIYKVGANWERSDNFRRDELLVLAKVADLAHTYLAGLGRQTDEGTEVE